MLNNDTYSRESSPAEQIASLVSGIATDVPAAIQKRQQKQKDDAMEQVKFYGDLRQSGYSPEEATKKVNRHYRSTSFIERMVNGDTNVFSPANQPDKTSMENRKTQADLKKTMAETRKLNAQADAGGFSPKSRFDKLDGLTPNQLQMRIKDLRNQVGMGSEEDDTEINEEITYLNDLFNKKSGFKEKDAAPASEIVEPKTKKGVPGKNMVVMTGPDGKKYKIPIQNKAKALKRGFK